MAGAVVAVVDSGVNYSHPDLNDNILKDGGGQVVGYDFIDGDSDPMDEHYHGTHVAGTVAAEANGIDVIGVAPGVKIMPVRVLDENGDGTNLSVAQGILWAADHGADVINLSLGGSANSTEVEDAVSAAVTSGSVVVAAAGNSANNFDAVPANIVNLPMLYPAALSTVLSVGAVMP